MGGPPGAGGGPGAENPFDDPQMMNMFKGLLGNLDGEGGSATADKDGAPKD